MICRLLVLSLAALGTAQEEASEAVCSADSRDNCHEPAGKQESYYWPTAHGHWKHYTRSPYVGPFDLSRAAAWSWTPPEGEFSDMLLGSVIDDKRNIYVTGDQATYKLSPEGQLLWKYVAPFAPWEGFKHTGLFHPNAPALYDGAVYVNSIDGRLYAVDMETGREIWVKQVAQRMCCDTGHLAVYAGYVVAHTDPTDGGCNRCQTLKALNASTGDEIWSYRADNPVWDLMPDFVGDGTLVFQDITGRGYRNYLANGTNIWKEGGWPGSWTDGTQVLGPNGLVYTVQANGCQGPGCRGEVSAWRLEDGSKVWAQPVPEPPNVAPAIGELRPGEGLTLVVPTGGLNDCHPAAGALLGDLLGRLPQWLSFALFAFTQKLIVWLGDRQEILMGKRDQPFIVYALDAATGKARWLWEGPVYKRSQTIGDEKGFVERASRQIRSASCPALPAPRIGGDGTVYVKYKNGFFYAIKDHNGDGYIDPKTDVSSFDCGHDFSSIGSAHAPGLIVATSSGKVWGFKS